MACISYLDISGTPAHLRYLVQRLRRRLPRGAPVLVGLWPMEDAALKDPNTQQMIRADYFVSSLQEAVTACAKEALKAAEAETDTSAADRHPAAAAVASV